MKSEPNLPPDLFPVKGLQEADEYVIFHASWGKKVFHASWGKKSFMHPGGKKSFMHPGGKKSFMHPGGKKSFMHPGGKKSFMHPGGKIFHASWGEKCLSCILGINFLYPGDKSITFLSSIPI